ncbi:MAG: multidrug transporter AcrB [Oceanospirillaceae bacterium]|nr:multidrug transporter AcrB [Oceanospirillaceae bacterium]
MRHHSGPVAWMVNHGVAPNLLMAFLIIGGILMSLSIRKEFIPNTQVDMVIVEVAYPGATPSEMEQGVVLPVENELSGMSGFSEINSTAAQGSAVVYVELDNDTDRQQAYQEIQQAVNNITTFPDGIERPVVSIASRDVEVMELAMFGPMSPFALKQLAEHVKDRLMEAPEITRVELKGTPPEEIHIEIPQTALEAYGLSLQSVAQTVGNNALELSAGQVRTDGGDILVTLDNRMYWAGEFRDIPLLADDTGVQLRLGDIASVREGFSDNNREITYNGQTSVGFDIYRAQSQTPITVADATYRQLDEILPELPPGVQIIVTDDDGETYRQRLGLLLKNAGLGLILVLVLLSLFLEYRLAFWVTMGIPTAFMGAVLLLPVFDVSINMISMFAFIVALGIVVDDAIIAGENIFEHMQQGMSFPEAAVIGAREVGVPLAFAILTNIAAFLPILALPGMMGKLFIAIPIVVICCFLISWLEALFVLPSHLAHLKKKDPHAQPNVMERVQRRVDLGLNRFIDRAYRPLLSRCISLPGLTVAIAFFCLMATMAWAFSGRMGFSMFPRLEGEFVVATVELPANAPLSQAREVRDLVERKLNEVVEPIERQGRELVLSIEGDIEGSSVEVEGKLVDGEVRPVHAAELVNLWREAIGEIPGIRSLTFDSERGGGPSGGAGLTLELRGSRTDILAQAAADTATALAGISGTKDVANGFTSGKPEWNVTLTERGRSLGLEASDVAAQIRAALYGSRALRQQRNSSEVTVLVRLPEGERSRSADIEQLQVITPAGGYVPLSDVAYLEKATSPSTISRRNGRQVVQVTADVEPREQIPAVMNLLRTEVFPDLQARYPGVDFGFSGRQQDTQESSNALSMYGMMSLLIIYVMLAIPFRSYAQPMLIMAVIPFGAAGAVLGHIMTDKGLSIMSIMGIVALGGVVVNDSLILVDYANRLRRERGLSARDAILQAGVRRFRPILLTTLTTFFGLAPMLFETSRQAQFITPMAVSLGFGILFTTFVCLLVLPALYILLASVLDRLPGREPLEEPAQGQAG